jgi:hydroxypyruvate isomerase
MFRTQDFLARGSDYTQTAFDEGELNALRRAQKEIGAQISTAQAELGLTKSQRDKEQHDSVGAYITSLKVRAKEHGVKREKELGRALELMHELFAVVDAFQRSNAAERAKLEMEKPEDVLRWIQEYIEVEFKAVDDYFREHAQRFWIRSM